ncbi:hypothetical protein POX_g08574 [Penicillium oxalicum]|uniref:Uncharacterized protein n=1 Tax=Penicillium oxalicum (strain 114-2 / CGMCC 5302) TaxID=933388 RepID=S8AYR9_PENO1|nr:hypothetical protein POX_g08574 [Penicillium oxalicum]EPS27127.1 hypothetical protein PDE_02069 [Penicillium oxalicum 114-2]KAI2786192.1 hypothetical protein POX_g08574 [Penicillium oxalicum]
MFDVSNGFRFGIRWKRYTPIQKSKGEPAGSRPIPSLILVDATTSFSPRGASVQGLSNSAAVPDNYYLIPALAE